MDWREGGIRRWRTFDDKDTAKKFLGELLQHGGGSARSAYDAKITVKDFAKQ